MVADNPNLPIPPRKESQNNQTVKNGFAGRFEYDFDTRSLVLIPDEERMAGFGALTFKKDKNEDSLVGEQYLPNECALFFDDDGAGRAKLTLISCDPQKTTDVDI
ncbi:MAG: hypothetical protein GQ532_09875 [Methylomarinum sp.]|nr:hypothetical protein [Methylomarinum sp.]